MCRIWDWQATIVRDLNDSQDPKHMLYCRESAFVAILRVFFLLQKTNVFPKLGSLIFELPVKVAHLALSHHTSYLSWTPRTMSVENSLSCGEISDIEKF